MKTIETKHQWIFQSKDENGRFEFRVHKDCSQIQLEVSIDHFEREAFVDINRKELTAIRDMINNILENQ